MKPFRRSSDEYSALGADQDIVTYFLIVHRAGTARLRGHPDTIRARGPASLGTAANVPPSEGHYALRYVSEVVTRLISCESGAARALEQEAVGRGGLRPRKP